MPDIQEYERRLGLWIAALESGDFKQGQGFLCDGTSYCCLGVLSELYRRETGNGIWVEYGDSDLRDFQISDAAGSEDPEESSDTRLVPSVREWIGLRSSEGYFDDLGGEFQSPESPAELRAWSLLENPIGISLVGLNDGSLPHGDKVPLLDFKQIAAVLRSRPRGLFTWMEDEEEESNA